MLLCHTPRGDARSAAVVLQSPRTPPIPRLLMRRFNRGYALIFLLILLVALLTARWTHQQVEGRYQADLARLAAYTFDDWIALLRLEELLGDPPVTPVPLDDLLHSPTPTPAP